MDISSGWPDVWAFLTAQVLLSSYHLGLGEKKEESSGN